VALKLADKCLYHTEENIFHMSLDLFFKKLKSYKLSWWSAELELRWTGFKPRWVQSSAGFEASGQVFGLIPRKYFLYVTWLSWWSAELSSDGSGSNLAGFNPRLALKQVAKFWSHAEENVFHMSLSLDGRALNTSSDGRGQTSVGSILGWL
jgi:hypothetical protein